MSEHPELTPEFIESNKLNELTEDQIRRAVYVSNISGSTSEKEVQDFFSFCGGLERVVQAEDPVASGEGKQFAVVVFEEEAAASTALLLSNAVIGDVPIAVQPYGNSMPQPAPHPSSQEATSNNGKTATAVVASLAAAGYLTGEGVLAEMKNKAHQYDSKLNISNKARYAFEVSAKACRDIDRDFQISTTLAYLKDQTLAGARSLDNQYQLSAYASSAATTAGEYASKAMENETVKASMGWLSEQYNAASTALFSTWQDLETRTRDEIEREHAERQGEQPQQQQQQQQQPSGNEGSSSGAPEHTSENTSGQSTAQDENGNK
eukprot:gb/GECH01011384.1/.p1 GENE.gb/GECH01011384.1/~~gb/GECH01011384.1/.p1  ORF type:complete len:321 (+),score=85.51 gb/GECH01011384.1/:1-963(+)